MIKAKAGFPNINLTKRPVATLWTFALLAVSVCAADAEPTDAALALIHRIVPKQAAQFAVEIIPADNGHDVFELESRDGKVVLRGNDAVSVASALNWYLKKEGNCDVSWLCGDQLNLSDQLPPVPDKVRIVSPHQFRYAYNFCTYGYTMAWWHWPQWEHELDYLAMNGVNLALVMEGQESVWINTFTNFGCSGESLRGWVVDPAHQPWMYMDNMESYGGPLSPHLVAQRFDLGSRIVTRMRELGIEPVLPGYYGMVPPDFAKKYPAAAVHIQGNWNQIKRPDILDPNDPVFPKVAAAYYAAENKLFSGAHFYDADPFHEGGATDHIDIPGAGRAIQKAMDGATWVLQGWQANPRQEMADAIDKNHALILDLFCEDREDWRLRNNYNGTPWVWGVINCFGGNLKTGGRLAWMARGPDNALLDPHRGRMSGIGALMEATGVNPVLWEMLLENAWRTNAPDLTAWLNDYAERRYGAKIPAAEQAWRIMADTLYAAPPPNGEHTIKPAVCARPLLGQSVSGEAVKDRAITKPYYDTTRVVEAWRLLLSAAPQAKSSDGYLFDLCDVGRQVLADLSTRYDHQIAAAYEAGDAAKLRQLRVKMLGLIRDLDTLTGTRREWLFGTWIADARSWGGTPEEKDLCERNARELLTTWTSHDNIPDYANRQWNGLLGDFYFHRWAVWLGALNEALAHHQKIDELAVRAQIRDWEIAWTHETGRHFATEPQGDAVTISQKLFDKYAADAARSLVPGQETP